MNPLAAGLNLSPGLKTDASSKEIEEAMKRVREAQSLISAAIEPGSEFFSHRSFSLSQKSGLKSLLFQSVFKYLSNCVGRMTD